MFHKILLILSVLFIFSCGWTSQCIQPTSYVLNIEKITSVGTEMMQCGCFKTLWEPTGLNRTIFKRVPQEEINSWVVKELLYSGRQNNTLHIAYREYTYRGLARPSFSQNLYYDLSTSDKIVFRDWVIQIINANNQQIRFKVIKEPTVCIE